MCAKSLQRHLIEIKIVIAVADTRTQKTKERKNMGRLPYDKQYELAYQIYEALCAEHPNWLVALSDTRAVIEKRAAAALARRRSSNTEDKSTGSVKRPQA
jgi:hypothetical protein